jgi:hypothetical protein
MEAINGTKYQLHNELEEKESKLTEDMMLGEKAMLLEEHPSPHPRGHKETAQLRRKGLKSQKSTAENLVLGTKRKNPFARRNSDGMS